MRKNKNETERAYTTLDSFQAGFLTLKGHTPELKLVGQGQKVVFVFALSDALLRDLGSYNSGALVEASRFAFSVKTLKSQIHSLRRNKEDDFAGNFK